MPEIIREEVVVVSVADEPVEDNRTMRELSRSVETYYRQPSPEVTLPLVESFPPLVLWGLLFGAVLGAVLGWIVGALLHDGTIVITGSEGMFSMYPDAFMIFWTGMGVAFGSLIIGVITQFFVPVPQRTREE